MDSQSEQTVTLLITKPLSSSIIGVQFGAMWRRRSLSLPSSFRRLLPSCSQRHKVACDEPGYTCSG